MRAFLFRLKQRRLAYQWSRVAAEIQLTQQYHAELIASINTAMDAYEEK